MIVFDPADVAAAVRNNSAFKLTAEFWTGTTRFKFGDEAYVLEMRDGEFIRFERDDGAAPVNISISAPIDVWEKLFAPVPPPGYQFLFTAYGSENFQLEGDVVRDIAPHFHAVQEFFEILRGLKNGPVEEDLPPEIERDFDTAVGRYVYVHVQGVQYRVYYEESGEGELPVILGHTCGSDSRQWRHVLEDPDYRKLCRMIAIDLPFHGRSLPPATQKWWDQPFKATREFILEAVAAISKKLKLDRPVFMGSAMSGAIAIDLAYYYPDDFRAVVSLNGGLGTPFDYNGVEVLRALGDPRVGNQWRPAMMMGSMTPNSSDVVRREFSWVYAQSGPNVFQAYLNYYAKEHDLTFEQAQQIDTSKCAVYLLTGEYDVLAADFGTPQLAAAVKGSHFRILPGLSHFGPMENHEAYKAFVLPVLQEIAGASARSPALQSTA